MLGGRSKSVYEAEARRTYLEARWHIEKLLEHISVRIEGFRFLQIQSDCYACGKYALYCRELLLGALILAVPVDDSGSVFRAPDFLRETFYVTGADSSRFFQNQ